MLSVLAEKGRWWGAPDQRLDVGPHDLRGSARRYAVFAMLDLRVEQVTRPVPARCVVLEMAETLDHETRFVAASRW